MLAAPRFALALLFATPAVTGATTPAKLAELARDPVDPTAQLVEALHAEEPLARATAARVANVRDQKTVLPALREALAAEKDADAAREELRAIVALGDDDDVAAMAKMLPAYPARMDAAFAEAVARLGAPRAIDLYAAHVQPLRILGDRSNFFTLALWNRADLATAVASRILGMKDARGWRELLHAAEAGRVAIGTEVLIASMESSVAEIREETLLSIVREHPLRGYPLPEGLQAAANATHADATRRELAAHEILRRAAGARARDNEAILAWVATDAAKDDLRHMPSSVLTRRELRTFHGITRNAIDAAGDDLPPPDLTAPTPLPAGLTQAVLTDHACQGGWVGIGSITADEHLRATNAALEKVLGTEGCIAALQTLLKLSLVEPSSITSGKTATGVCFVAPESGAPCLDEASVASRAVPGRVPLYTSDVHEAQVLARVTPQFPAEARISMAATDTTTQIVTVEATITTAGCPADLRVVRPSDYESIDDAALLAVARWTFKPATRGDVPVDSVARIAVKFQLK
jgi:TonB family protein